MKKILWVLLSIIILSCSTSKIDNKKNKPEFEIVKTQIITNNDTISINELRFYKIHSAFDGMMLMYHNYGEWDTKINGKHQNNVTRFVWENVQLLDENSASFTVIADGTETLNQYFICLMVFDSEENDCFNENHPQRDQLIDLFVKKMNKGFDRKSPF